MGPRHSSRQAFRHLMLFVLAATATIFMLYAEPARCQDVQLYAGGTHSEGLGEQRLSPSLIGEVLFLNHLRATGFWEPSAKVESGEGSISGIDTDLLLLNSLILGAEYHYRDGGPWAKQTVNLRGGVKLYEGAELIFRREMWSDAERPNESYGALLRMRARYNRFMIGGNVGVLSFKDWQRQRRVGHYSQILMGVDLSKRR